MKKFGDPDNVRVLGADLLTVHVQLDLDQVDQPKRSQRSRRQRMIRRWPATEQAAS